MLIKSQRSGIDLPFSSEITPRAVFESRRDFIRQLAVGSIASASLVEMANREAFAQSPTGAWAWRAERTSREFAIEDAVNACNTYLEATEPRCVVIHVDNEWVTP